LPEKLNVKKTCKAEFLEQMERAVRWAELVALIAPYDRRLKGQDRPITLRRTSRNPISPIWGIEKSA
jgi:hypothetical protein